MSATTPFVSNKTHENLVELWFIYLKKCQRFLAACFKMSIKLKSKQLRKIVQMCSYATCRQSCTCSNFLLELRPNASNFRFSESRQDMITIYRAHQRFGFAPRAHRRKIRDNFLNIYLFKI